MTPSLNDAIGEFNEQIKPLTDTLEAIYELRQRGPDTLLGIFNEIQAERQAAPGAAPPSKYGDLAEQKKKLRELLEMSEEDSAARQQQLVAAAKRFIGEKEDDPEAVRVAEKTSAWMMDGCPTEQDVTLMKPLSFRRRSFFNLFSR